MKKIFYNKSALPLILKALNIVTNIPNERIMGITKNKDGTFKILENEIDLFLAIEKFDFNEIN
jgi:hypothetical protein